MNQLRSKALETLTIRFLSQAFTFAASIILARALGAYGKGVMTYAATVSALVLTAWSGQASAISWQYGRLKTPSGAVARATLRILLFAGLPIALAVLLIGFLVPNQQALIAAGAALPFYFFANGALGFFLTDGNVRIANIQALIGQAGFCIGIAVVLLGAHGGLTAALVIWVGSIIASGIYTGWAFKRYLTKSEYGRINDLVRAQIKFGIKASGGAVAWILNSRIDVFIITFFLGLKALGIYSIALGLGEQMWQLSAALVTSAFGRIATGSRAEAVELTAKCARHTFIAVLCMGLAIFVFGPPLIVFLYGPAFAAAGPVLRVLVPGLIAYSMMPFLGTFFTQQLGKPGITAGLASLSLVICTCVTLATIRPLGIVGGALGTTVSYAVAFMAAILIFLRTTNLPPSRLFVPTLDDCRIYMDAYRMIAKANFIETSILQYFRRAFFMVVHPVQFHRLQKDRKRITVDGYSYRPFDEHRCIFVHIPRCGGVSVCRSLFGNLAGGHTTIQTYQMIFSPPEFYSYFKFTVVRNPWDRLVSAFLFLKAGGMNDADAQWAQNHLAEYDDFDTFVRGWVNTTNIRSGVHFLPQREFICVGNRRPCVDFIAHYETLESDFLYVCGRLRINPALLKLNSNRARDSDYRKYYTEETRRRVGDVYADDIRLLGYSFDNAEAISGRVPPSVSST